MQIVPALIGLALLLAAVPLYFSGSTHLLQNNIEMLVEPQAALVPWVIAALCLYRSALYRAFCWAELLKFTAYGGVVSGVFLLGISLSFPGVVSVSGL